MKSFTRVFYIFEPFHTWTEAECEKCRFGVRMVNLGHCKMYQMCVVRMYEGMIR